MNHRFRPRLTAALALSVVCAAPAVRGGLNEMGPDRQNYQSALD